MSEKVAFADLDMNIRDIKCYDMSVGDISIDHDQMSDTAFFVTVGVTKLDLTCEMNYDYSYGILSGDGWVQIQTENNEAFSTISFTSLDFNQNYPPTDVAVDNCFSDVEIKRLDFEEDFASEVLEVFQILIRNTIEIAIGDVACEELSVIGTTVVGDMIEKVADQLEPYLGHLGETVTDPLYLEHNLILPDCLEALNLQDTEGDVGKTFNQILLFFDTNLGAPVSESFEEYADSSSTETGLVINSILRSFFLNDDGSLRLDPSSTSMMMNPVLFEGHDRLTEFTVTLNEVRLYGLDSITRFNSFRSIGKYTLQNELTWDLLKFEFDVILDIRPSKLDDAILIDPTSPGISERFSIDFTVKNIDVEASFLLVLDEIAMGSMELGSLFDTKNLLPCLLSIVHAIKLSGLHVDPSYINDAPTVDGFLSSGLDRVISDSVEAAFSMYEGSLRAAIPNIFQTNVRELINTFLVDFFIDDRTESKCPELQSLEKGFIDFRNFFNSTDRSYGDLPGVLKNMLDDELLNTNPETGKLRFNEALVAPFTRAQSGIKGTMVFPIDLFSFLIPKAESQKFGMESLELRIFDPKIENLDTIGAPIQLLEPNATYGQVIDNYATLGSVAKKLRIGFKGLFAIEGAPSFTMANQMDISVQLAGSDAWVSLMAKVDTEALFNFPLRDITNLQCWLYTLAAPDVLDGSEEIRFSIFNALLTTTSMTFDLTCASCTSSSLFILPEVLDSLEASGVSDVVEKQLVKFILNLLRSDYSQVYINEILMEATIRCPHSPKYIASSASISENRTVEFPSLDYESLQTIIFVSTVVTEIAMVVIAQAHESYDLETTFPLSGQYDLNETKHVRLIDFTSPETNRSVNNLFLSLTEVVSDPNGINEKSDLRVNSLTRSILLDKNGLFSVPFDGISLMGISIKEMNIGGLDTISEINIFNAIGAQTIQNGISWESIRIQLVLSLDDPNESQLLEEEDITISADFSDVNLSLAMLMAVDADLFDSLEIWSITNLKNVLPCILSTADTARFTEFELSMGSINGISITGFASNEISSSANESSRLILDKYGDMIISSIPKVFDSTVRTLLNNWLKYQMDELTLGLCKYSPSDKINGSRFVDLRDLLRAASVASRLGGTGLSQYGDMFRIAMGLVQDIFKIDDSTGLSGFNEAVVDPLTKSKDNELGEMHYFDLFHLETRIKVGALDTNVQFRAYDAKIENLNTVGAPLELFSGIEGEAFMLNNIMAAGVGENPLRFSSKILLSLEGDDDIDIRNEVDLSLEVTDARIIVTTLTKIAETRLFGFPLRDVFDLNCWLATIPAPVLDPQGVRKSDSVLTASLSYLEAQVGELIVTANCTNCSSPRMADLTNFLSSPGARNETTDTANAVLDYMAQLIGGNFLQVQIDRMLNEAARKCSHSLTYEPDAKPFAYEEFETPNPTYSIGHLISLTAVTFTLILLVLAIVLTVKFIVRRRHNKWLIKLPPNQIKNLHYQQKSALCFEDKLNIATKSMFRSPDIPCIVQFAIPIVIVCNVLLFLSGHLSLGATVNIEAELAGEKITVEKFFEFSMARSTIDIWKAGGRELAILIIIFSGIWPYTKLLITLWLWLSPPSNISISRRGSILLWLDSLAKWSMIDIFVLVISIAAFRVSIESPDTSYLPNSFYAIEMMVIPLWGLYANMSAQLISQITSHVIIYYHRKIVDKATERSKLHHLTNAVSPASTEVRGQRQDPEARTDGVGSSINNIGQEQSNCTSSFEDVSIGRSTSMSAVDSVNEETISLSAVQFSRPHRGETEKLVVRKYVNKLLSFCAISVVVCVVAGCVLPSFSLEFFGLVGVAVEFGQDSEEATSDHSIFSVIRLLFDQASYLDTVKDYLGLAVLSVLFVSTILIVPIIQSTTLLRQWFSISTAKQKRKIAVRLEILQAWQYLEVYIVALLVSSWQLGPVSDFMINVYCKNLEDTFAQMVYFGVLKEEDAQCFGVTSRIGHNSFVLVAGAILLTFLSSFVCKATVQYLRNEKQPKLRLKGNDDHHIRFPNETSYLNDDHELADDDLAPNFHPVPVFFTDTFRWMLKANDNIITGTRTFVAPNNSHWSLPEATVVTSSESFAADGRVVKGTHVHDLVSTEKVVEPDCSPFAARGSLVRQGSIDLASTISFDSYQSSPRGIKLKDDDVNIGSYRLSRLRSERRESSTSSLGRQSINSKMDSIGSSTNDENFEANSLVHSVNTNSSIESPPAEAVTTVSPGAFRNPPPPHANRLSNKLLKKSPPRFSTTHARSTHPNQKSIQKLPHLSSNYTHSVGSKCSRETLFVDDDEYNTVKSISDIIKS